MHPSFPIFYRSRSGKPLALPTGRSAQCLGSGRCAGKTFRYSNVIVFQREVILSDWWFGT